ncbi:MAG: hypothetical protein Sapg2KO_09810 [Saprospiraceae bacterium]
MRHQLLCLLFLTAVIQLNAQSDEDLIRHSIQNYFNGTAYNYLDQIESAFHPEANLFLENQAGELVIFSAADYIALFKKNTPGQFIGRYSKILSIDIEGNLAQVKAEILMPKRKRRYIDVFIMRKNKTNQWQIIGKAANSSAMD